jgi:hypothetical protein
MEKLILLSKDTAIICFLLFAGEFACGFSKRTKQLITLMKKRKRTKKYNKKAILDYRK